MMTREHRQEALSLAYVHAVAAVAGVTHSSRSNDYGIDLMFHEVDDRDGGFVETGRAIDAQLKSTTTVAETRSHVGYDLSLRLTTCCGLRRPFLGFSSCSSCRRTKPSG